MFGDISKENIMQDDNHTKMDTSIPLNDKEHLIYWIIIGVMEWVVCLGMFDVCSEVSSLSCLPDFSRKEHFDRVMRLFGYLKKNKK